MSAPTQAGVEKLCRRWQEILRLQDWMVRILLVPAKELDGDRAQVNRPTANKRLAVIRICDPAELEQQADPPDIEISLVHELLHLHLWEMSDAMESLSDELGHVANAVVCMAKRLHDQAEERAVWMLAHVLVGLHRDRSEEANGHGEASSP